MKHTYENIKEMHYSKIEISIRTKILDNVRNLTNLSCLAKMTPDEHFYQFFFNQKKIDLKCADLISISEFKIKNCNITDGEVLSRDRLLLADSSHERCVLFNIDGEVLKEISLPGKPWVLRVHEENKILVTLPDNKEVVILDVNSLE